jgi:hypothetical protein
VLGLWSPRGSLRDLTLAASEIGEQAVETGGPRSRPDAAGPPAGTLYRRSQLRPVA